MTKVIAVVGLGFGDEGKGMVTDTLSSLNPKPLTIRFSGGHQAGHTVHHEGMKHSFANFGAGVLRGIPSYWSSYCTVDPVGLLNELKVLGDTMGDRAFEISHTINAMCPVVTPYDKYHNQTSEKINKHGTCGVGFGSTIQRSEKGPFLTFSDLYNHTVLHIKMDMIGQYYDYASESCLEIEEFHNAIDDLIDPKKFPSDVIKIADATGNPETMIFEGSQGILLDMDFGFFPHVTRSKTTTYNVWDVIEHIDEIYYVTRAYQTRHGNGPMTNENLDLTLINIEHESNELNDHQGMFRRSPLDLNLLKYAVSSDRSERRGKAKENLVITCMDQIVDWRYTKDGRVVKCESENDFINHIACELGIEGNVYLSRSAESGFTKWKEEKS